MQKGVAAAFKEIARVIRVFQVGGRRVANFHAQQRERVVVEHQELNRKQRRHYLAVLRKQHGVKPQTVRNEDSGLVVGDESESGVRHQPDDS